MRGRILVVDDSPVMRRLMVRTLGEAGVPFEEISEAHNGLEAMTVLERDSVRLILLDPVMPVMSGEELLSRVRTDDHHRDVPVIVVSNECDPARLARLGELGIQGFLHKPFTVEELRDVAGQTLGEAYGTLTAALVTELLENLLEGFALETSPPAEMVDTILHDRLAHVSYSGSRTSGEVYVSATDGFLSELAAGLLGRGPEQIDVEAQGLEALRELSSRLVDEMVRILGHATSPFDVGAPETLGAFPPAEGPHTVRVQVCSGLGRLEVRLDPR